MNKNNVTTFEDLECWQKCRELRIFVCGKAKGLPKEEKYRLVDQVIRSSRSITANIAEGYGRFHYKENLQFCRQARGSLYETLDHFIAGKDDGLILEKDFSSFKDLFDESVKVLNGYIRYLDKCVLNKKS